MVEKKAVMVDVALVHQLPEQEARKIGPVRRLVNLILRSTRCVAVVGFDRAELESGLL